LLFASEAKKLKFVITAFSWHDNINYPKKLITYLADAEDSKVKAIYTLLEREMLEEDSVELTDEQMSILESERELHLSGQSKSYSREEARQIIKGERDF